MTVAVEVSMPPEAVAGLAAIAAVAVIEYAALRWDIATISVWSRYHIRRHPILAATVGVGLTLHLVVDVRADPLCWLAGRVERRSR